MRCFLEEFISSDIKLLATGRNPDSDHPPSFAESQFDVIRRRQRTRYTQSGGLKVTASPSRFLNLPDDHEFAGWGTVSYLELTDEDIQRGEAVLKADNDSPIFGPWTASAVAANEIFGSVFYAFAPVVAVAGV